MLKALSLEAFLAGMVISSLTSFITSPIKALFDLLHHNLYAGSRVGYIDFHGRNLNHKIYSEKGIACVQTFFLQAKKGTARPNFYFLGGRGGG